jgi:hypothetical protein
MLNTEQLRSSKCYGELYCTVGSSCLFFPFKGVADVCRDTTIDCGVYREQGIQSVKHTEYIFS